MVYDAYCCLTSESGVAPNGARLKDLPARCIVAALRRVNVESPTLGKRAKRRVIAYRARYGE